MCADFVISLSPVSQRRTNSWVLTQCFHRGFFFFFTVKYQSICTGKNQSMLSYFLFLTHAEWRGWVQFGRVEQEELHHLLVYPSPSSLTGLQTAEVRSSEVRHYYMPSKGYPGCAQSFGLIAHSQSRIQLTCIVAMCSWFLHHNYIWEK